MEQNENGGYPLALFGEPVTVLPAIPFQQAVSFHLAQVIAELGRGVGVGGEANAVRMASWICAVRQPPICVPPCSSTSNRRIIRVSWILMPGILVRPQVIGRARRWNSGKSYVQADVKVFFAKTPQGRFGFRLSYIRGRLPPVFARTNSFRYGAVFGTGDDSGN